jgi:signal transduction histidine kinase
VARTDSPNADAVTRRADEDSRTHGGARSSGPLMESGDETRALRNLARAMAGVTDTTELLEILCTAAAEQCAATGAAVLKAAKNDGEVMAATGPLTVTVGRRFGLLSSLMREVLRTRDVVASDDFAGSAPSLTRAVPDVRVGPLLLGPLIAHDVILGVLVVTREPEAPVFSRREILRLRAIADYAALALWKAELLENAKAADRAKGRFLATVSHELRTPLAALAGYEELLADQVIGPLSENQRDVIERMRAVTQHLTAVIEEVLEFSRLEGGHECAHPTEFLVADIVHASAAVIEPLARQKQIGFSCDMPYAPIRMTSDVDKMRQIIVNLAGNAVKFTDRGDVRIEVTTRGSTVCVAVHDTGIGIAPDDLERLFQPFAQLDASLTRRHGGTGLGLYIAQRLAALLGGQIEARSVLGVGSSFTLELPF